MRLLSKKNIGQVFQRIQINECLEMSIKSVIYYG